MRLMERMVVVVEDSVRMDVSVNEEVLKRG